MRNLFLVFAIFCALKTNAQNYLITFTGTGASTTVSTVKVENLTKGTSLTLDGSDILHLTVSTGINSYENKQSSELKIYPNPMSDNSILQISPPAAGSANITVLDMTGKPLAQIQSHLENSLQEFCLSGINTGFYLIIVRGSNYQYSGKLLCNGKADGSINIEKISNNLTADEKTLKMDDKGVQATVDMVYTTGDRLKFAGISGIYGTIKTDIPASDKTITFNFIACSDVDNNNYPIVQIDAQIWMAENLKTRKYNNGEDIPNVTDNAAWIGLTTGAYCDYNNTPGNSDIYGRLYNFYTVSDSRKICPTDWHVPLDGEWTTLINYLGGESVAGGKLKETGTIHWTSPNTGATNETGFTALPGGYRWTNGAFSDIGGNNPWWTGTEYLTSSAYIRRVYYLYSDILKYFYDKLIGFSVRCIKD